MSAQATLGPADRSQNLIGFLRTEGPAKSSLLLGVVCSLFLVALIAPIAARADTAPQWLRDQCRFQMLDDRPGYTISEVRRTVRCAAWRWYRGRVQTLRCIIEHESGYVATAANPSGAAGVFQIVRGTWASWRFGAFRDRAQMLHLSESVFDARANVLVGTWAAAAYGTGAWAGSGC